MKRKYSEQHVLHLVIFLIDKGLYFDLSNVNMLKVSFAASFAFVEIIISGIG